MKKISCASALMCALLVTGCTRHSTQTSDVTVTPQPTSYLQQSVYTIDTSGTSEAGRIMISPYYTTNPNSGQLMVMDEKGNLLQQKSLPNSAFCFRKWIINGQTRYTYIVNDPGTYHIPVVNALTGYAVIADSNFNEIKRVYLTPYNEITTSQNEGLDVHDFILLSDDHYICMSYYAKAVTNIPAALSPARLPRVVTPVIQEINNGAVVWQWVGCENPEFYSTSVESNNFSDTTGTAQDYMHMNSMIIDPRDNNLICSFRNLNQILKINHITGSVMWRLGGNNSDFPLTASQVFLRQHDATLTDENNTLMLFDNGDATLRPQSRIVEMQINESSKSVIGFKSFNIPEPFTQFMGSVQKMGDNYFIGGGTAQYVLEVNYLTGQKLLEMTSKQATYRAYKF
ncbi:aryl-sulfate sulfotransferase [Chitinophagaceae bacterium MMS25-I14]